MNHLVLLQEELQADGTYLVVGERAQYVKEFHRFDCGKSYSGLLYGKGRGELLLLDKADSHFRFALKSEDEAPNYLDCTLIVALSRPQTMKKVLQYGAMLRVKKIVFLPGELGEKSYRSSKILTAENLRYELIKGLEQIGSPYAPEVVILERFHELSEFLSDHKGARVLAEPKSNMPLDDFLDQNSEEENSYMLAIGSERGWSEDEVDQFSEMKFHSVRLLEDHLRVEVAMVAMITKLLL